MPSKMWDSPMKKQEGYEDFPGDKSGPGIYNNNPLLEKPTSGGFNMKFQETIPRGKEIPIDSPQKKFTPDKVNPTPDRHSASDNVGAKWDTPFTTKNGKMGGK